MAYCFTAPWTALSVSWFDTRIGSSTSQRRMKPAASGALDGEVGRASDAAGERAGAGCAAAGCLAAAGREHGHAGDDQRAERRGEGMLKCIHECRFRPAPTAP